VSLTTNLPFGKIFSNECSAHMKEMFRFSIDRACELILEQIRQSQRGGNIQLKVCRCVIYSIWKSFHYTDITCSMHSWSVAFLSLHTFTKRSKLSRKATVYRSFALPTR